MKKPRRGYGSGIAWLTSLVETRPWPDECQEWPGTKYPNGYGQINFQGKVTGTHRVAYLLAFGALTDGLFVLHGKERACVSKACCNPGHLREGTALENMADRERDGTVPRGDTHGSHTHPESRPRGDKHYSHLHPEKVARGDANGSRTRPDRVARGDANGSRTHPERLKRGDEHYSRTNPELIQRGEAKPQAKITEDIVREIRRRRGNNESCGALAAEFGVGKAVISDVAMRKTWKHVE